MDKPRYQTFYFDSYTFDRETGVFEMHYNYDDELHFVEKATFELVGDFNERVLDNLLFYTFIVAGTSYYKSYLAPNIELRNGQIDAEQAEFFTYLYRGGLSQFLYENKLRPEAITGFSGNNEASHIAQAYDGDGILLMESGGKDSLLSAELLKLENVEFDSWHMSTTGTPPPVLDLIGANVYVSKRTIDLKQLRAIEADGALQGHIPFSALFAGYALIQAVLLGKNLVLSSNESSSNEANVEVDGMVVNHQFSKTYEFELRLQDYLHKYVSQDLNYASLLRPLNELRVAELFTKYAWEKYSKDFSSCNLFNYKQGDDGKKLGWDGNCPKCANAYLLFAPFVSQGELNELFDGQNLLHKSSLEETFKQLWDLSEVKPFECVGTFEEMQAAYEMAVENDPTHEIDFAQVPKPRFDRFELSDHQPLIEELINFKEL